MVCPKAPKSGSPPKKLVGECQVLAKIEAVRLSHDANGMTRLPTKTLDGGQVTNRRPLEKSSPVPYGTIAAIESLTSETTSP